MSEAETHRPPARPWWAVVLVVVAIAAVAFAIGRFSTFGSGAATTAPGTDSAEAGFSRDMQAHHAQAVEMAMEIYRKTDDQELRALSYDIATGQAAQRGEMYDWLVKWGLPQSGGPMMAWMADASGDSSHGHGGTSAEMTDEEARAAMGMASDAELRELAAATGQAADCLFLELMIRHHEGAIPMAEAVVELASEQRVIEFAESIIAGQSAEIDTMTSMQARLGCG